MSTFGKLGEQVRWIATAASLGLSAIAASATATTAQDIHNTITQTTFSSMQEASRAAQDAGMVLARAFHGEMLFVSPELAQLLDAQGFEYGRDGILYGWTQESFGASLRASLTGQGYNFARGSEYIGANSTHITIDESQHGEGPDGNDGPDLEA